MIELIVDLRELDPEGGDSLADHGAVQRLEGILLDYVGKVIRIRVWEVAPSRLKELDAHT